MFVVYLFKTVSVNILVFICRKLKATIDEYTIRVGQQAVVLVVTPGKPQNNFKVFGAHPLENVVCLSGCFLHILQFLISIFEVYFFTTS